MAVKVKTPYWGRFNMPGICATCGHPAGTGTTWKVSGSKSSGWGGKTTTTLNLELPLCQGCYEVSRNKTLGKVVGCLGIGLAVVACLGSAGLLGSDALGDSFVAVVIGLLVTGLFAGAGIWLAELVQTQGFTPEQRKRRGVVKKCAKITGFKAPGLFDKQGWIQFQFQNLAFANEFARLNMGQMA